MIHTSPKPSKIPVPNKKAKMLKPLKCQMLDDTGCFKYCRSCCDLKKNLSVLEQNLTTLLKENNFLRQQLSNSNSDTYNSKQATIISSQVECEKDDSLQNASNPPVYSNVHHNSIEPFHLLSGVSFSNFDVSMLCSEIDYSHCLNNRKVKFY